MIPVCLLNAEFLIGDRFEPALLAYPFSDLFSRWLDKNNVKGDPENEAIARRMLRLYRAVDWTLIQPPFGGLGPIIAVYKRLTGLCGEGEK